AYLQAGQDAGYPLNDDYNGARQEGVGYLQSTIRRGHRCSAADAYQRWPRLSEQFLRIDKWSVCRG
ncbi:MAG: choline dehydrogenase, partial [Methyloceanibacter sp.]